MNDRFKFRVWWKKENRYRKDVNIIPIGHLENFSSYEFVIEQCTGLRDKNGNLIYEGDIVKCRNITGIVKFGFYRKTDEHFPDSIYGFYIEWEKSDVFRQDFGYWVKDEIEIISNIYETKGADNEKRKE